MKCQLGLSVLPPHLMGRYFRQAAARFAAMPVPECSGTGIIICGGGVYEQWALASLRHLRAQKIYLPVELWSLNADEVRFPHRFEELGATVIPATRFLVEHPMRIFAGWHLKAYAILHSRLRNVLFLDADCFADSAGVELFNHPSFANGALFFPDIKRCHGSDTIYKAAGLKAPWQTVPKSAEWETGQFLVDKTRCHAALRLACWMSEHSDRLWTPLLHGEKGTTEIAFRLLNTPYTLGTDSSWQGWGIEHRLDGLRRFRHCIASKRRESPVPHDLAPFL